MSSPRLPDGMDSGFLDPREAVYDFVRGVPAGRVVTYGLVASSISRIRLTARMVGSAMRWSPQDVPWHRVVGSDGSLRTGKISAELMLRQAELLRSEGIDVRGDSSARVSLDRCLWIPGPDAMDDPNG